MCEPRQVPFLNQLLAAKQRQPNWQKRSGDNTLLSNVGDFSPLSSITATHEGERKHKHAKIRLIEDVNIQQDDTGGKHSTVSAWIGNISLEWKLILFEEKTWNGGNKWYDGLLTLAKCHRNFTCARICLVLRVYVLHLCIWYLNSGRRQGGLMFSTLASGFSGPGWSRGREY